MSLFGSLPVNARRTVVALGVAGMLFSTVATAQAQDPAAAAPQQAAPAAPDPFKFDGMNPVFLMLTVKSGQEATFEEAFTAVRNGLMAADNPQLQSQGRSMTLLRLTADMPPGANRPFVVYLDPPVAGVSYNFTNILYESGAWKADDLEVRKVIDEIYKKLADSVAEQAIWPLVKK
jgi:hypothetical protein